MSIISFLLGAITSVVLINYYVVVPLKAKKREAEQLIKETLEFLLLLKSVQDGKVETDREGNIVSPIQMGREGS